jgi:ribosomal protein S18 acetylase RimI-like enzyme
MDALTLRSVRAKDRDFLYRLKRATLKEYVEQTWGWDEGWQQAHFERTFDPTHLQVVVLDGKDIGMLLVERRDEEVFLGVIEILPAYQRRGIGTELIRSVLTAAFSAGIPVTLQVLKVNPARRLYERLGFGVVGETETHYLMKAVPDQADDLPGSC